MRVELVAQLDTVLTSRSFTATIGAVEFDVRAIDSSLTPARVAGDVQATGTFSALSAQANVELAHEAIGRATSRILFRRRAETWYADSLDLGFRDNLGRVTGGGTVVLVDGNPTVDATLTWLRLGVPLVGRHLFTTRGRVRAVGSADTYEIDANANVRGDATPAGSLRVLAVGKRDSIVIKGSGETLSGEVTLEGVVALAPALAWNIGLHAKDLNLSGVLPDSADSVRNVEITARAHGARSDSGLFGTVRVTRLAGELREIPFSVAGVARLLPDRVSFDSVNAELLGGELAAGGMLRFDPTVEWYLAATADDIDPAALMPNSAEWTGKLSGVAQFSGSRASETVSAEVTIDTISGVLRGERIGVKAGLRVDGDAYAIDSLSLRWGSLHLAAAGELSDEMHGRLELEAPNLSLAVPGASGSLQAEIDIDGTRTEPIISARVGGADFQYREYSAEQLFGGGVLNFTTGGRFDFSIDGTGLALSGRAIDTLGVSISGVRGDHEIAVSLRSGESSFVLGAVGGIADLDWAGDLVTLNLLDSATGDWMLERPTALQASQDHVASADSICVQSDDARACVVGTWQRGGQWSLATTAESIPFARFEPLLPPRINVSGDLDAQADFHTDELGALRGTAQITSTSGDIDLRLQSGEQALAYERGSVEVTADSSGVNTTLTVSLKQSGTGDSTYADVTGRLTLPGYRPLLDSVAQQPIEGQLQMSLSDLSWAEAVFPQLVATSGSLNLDFTLAGTTESPRVFGTARLSASADVPRLGLQLRNAELRAVGEGAEGIRIDGSVESGSGVMAVAGRLYTGSASDSVFALHISGTRAQAANTPEAQVWISPVLDIVKSGQQVSVSGEVQVPRAQIELREIPAVAVPVSRDVVIVGDTSQSQMPTIDIRSRVRMVLGDSVSFRGFGLT
ncbi:MAG: translocation/assembly module TamB domain-containing protein, partial [Gemmatimonadales bacterium]